MAFCENIGLLPQWYHSLTSLSWGICTSLIRWLAMIISLGAIPVHTQSSVCTCPCQLQIINLAESCRLFSWSHVSVTVIILESHASIFKLWGSTSLVTCGRHQSSCQNWTSLSNVVIGNTEIYFCVMHDAPLKISYCQQLYCCRLLYVFFSKCWLQHCNHQHHICLYYELWVSS